MNASDRLSPQTNEANPDVSGVTGQPSVVLPSAGDGQSEDGSTCHSDCSVPDLMPNLCSRELDDSSVETKSSTPKWAVRDDCDQVVPQAGHCSMQCPPTSVEFVVNVAERQANDHNVTSSHRRKKPHPGNEAMPDTGANVGCGDPETTQE